MSEELELNELYEINGNNVRITVVDGSINIHCEDTDELMAGMLKVNFVHSRLVRIDVDKPTKRNIL